MKNETNVTHQRQVTDATAPYSNEVSAKKVPGVYVALTELPPNTPLTLPALSKLLQCDPAAIRRAMKKGELPKGIKFVGKRTWTVGSIMEHIEQRIQEQA